MAIAILAQGVFDFEPAAPTYTQSFTVPAGTDMLLVLPTLREISGATGAPVITLLSYNGVAMTAGFHNYAAGTTGDINSLVGYLRSPSVGTFNVIMNCANTAGGAMWMLALSGVKATGSPVGATAAQKVSSSGSTSVGLGLTPTAGSMLLAALGSGANAGTVTGFTGTGFTETITGRYGNNGDMPYTARYRLSVAAAATTVTATFSIASVNNGGVLAEILAEASATTDVSGSADATVAVVGSISSGLAQAEILDASFRQISAWTELMTLQPDTAGVDRRIISAGVLGTPTYTLDQFLTNKNYSWNFRLTDGIVRIDSASNTQTLSPHHLALVHNGALGQAIFLNGVPTGQVIEGAGLSGPLIIATGGERIGSHGAVSPGPYTGLFGRYLLYEGAMTAEQVRLTALSESDPNAIWGIGSEDDAQVTNQSLVACPLHVDMNGQSQVTITPTILDPSGGTLDITAVIQPANGTLAIDELSLIYRPTPGWQGIDTATYTASDGIKSSTGRLTFSQTRPALKLGNDTITVASGGIHIFDPRTNDVGAGSLIIVTHSNPSNGVVTIEADGRLKYVNQTGGASDSFTYTVQDDYSQQTATVSVTITADDFLTAGDVSTSTTQGQFVDIDVVAAADASANLEPLVVKSGSITAPTLGTATLQADGKIRYTPDTGESGYTDEFEFTLKPSAAATPTDVGKVEVQVLTGVTGRPEMLPAMTGTARSVTPSTLQSVYNAATTVAGDHLVCDDGSYTANYTFNRNFGTTNPVIIRSATTHGAVFSGQLNVAAGTGHWFYELKLTRGADGGAILAGNYTTITRCWFTAREAIWTIFSGAVRHHIWIGWNRFNCVGLASTPSTNILFNKGSSGDAFNNCFVYRNYFAASGAVSTGGYPSYHIYMSPSKVFDGIYPGMKNDGDNPRLNNFIIEENFVSSNSVFQRFVYIKNGITGVYRNRVAGSMVDVMSQRHGRGTQWWGNRAPGRWNMGGGGTATLFTDMRRNVGGPFELGHGQSATGTDTNSHQAADYYLLAWNEGQLKIGYDGGVTIAAEGGNVNGVKIYKHISGTISINTAACDESTFTDQRNNEPPASITNPPASNITDANGLVLSTFDGTKTGMKTGNQD